VGFRFRRSFRLLPGIRLNVGGKSASLSFGGRGFHYTVGTAGRRVTVGLPGTGLSWSQKLPSSTPSPQPSPPRAFPIPPTPGNSVVPAQTTVGPIVSIPLHVTAVSPANKISGKMSASTLFPSWLLWAVPSVMAIAGLCFLASIAGH
jgi:hypothetical protein